MTTETEARRSVSDYGARPVSVDLARGRQLTQAAVPSDTRPVGDLQTRPLSHAVVADRLSLAHWPAGHRIVVCGLAGGTGRTVMAGLIATVLAELPYAHVHKPNALVDLAARHLANTRRRWDVVPCQPEVESPAVSAATQSQTRSGVHVLDGVPKTQQRHDHAVIVIDAPSGMPSDIEFVTEDENTSVLLMTRPDRASLAEASEALVWMHNQHLLARNRVIVAVNLGAGRSDRGSKAAAVALGIRCSAIHNLPLDATLGPSGPLPSGCDLPVRIRRVVHRICLDMWSATQQPAPGTPHQQEEQ